MTVVAIFPQIKQFARLVAVGGALLENVIASYRILIVVVSVPGDDGQPGLLSIVLAQGIQYLLISGIDRITVVYE